MNGDALPLPFSVGVKKSLDIHVRAQDTQPSRKFLLVSPAPKA